MEFPFAGSRMRNWIAAPAELEEAEPGARSLARERYAVASEEPRPAAHRGDGQRHAAGQPRPVVQDASFTLSKSQGVGIIGPSASGKSSLARLLVWTPVRGKVRLDGAALDQWSPEVLGRHIGYLPQAVALLPGTVGDIARFEAEPDPEAVIRAAEAAGVHDLILRLPDDYQTAIGEQGTGLSAGQQMRRALYGDPPPPSAEAHGARRPEGAAERTHLAVEGVD